MYICIYVYIYTHIYKYTYIHIYILIYIYSTGDGDTNGGNLQKRYAHDEEGKMRPPHEARVRRRRRCMRLGTSEDEKGVL